MSKNNNGGLNKVFQSVYKDEIEKRLAVGQSPRSISKWLETRGEQISHTTITNYKKEFFDNTKIMSDVVKVVQEQTADGLEVVPVVNKPDPVNQQINKIRAVNHIQVLYDNIQDMREYLYKLQSYEPVVAAHAAKGLYAEIRATIESLEKIQAKGNETDDSSVAKLLTALKSQKREMEKNGRIPSETSAGDDNEALE